MLDANAVDDAISTADGSDKQDIVDMKEDIADIKNDVSNLYSKTRYSKVDSGIDAAADISAQGFSIIDATAVADDITIPLELTTMKVEAGRIKTIFVTKTEANTISFAPGTNDVVYYGGELADSQVLEPGVYEIRIVAPRLNEDSQATMNWFVTATKLSVAASV